MNPVLLAISDFPKLLLFSPSRPELTHNVLKIMPKNSFNAHYFFFGLSLVVFSIVLPSQVN